MAMCHGLARWCSENNHGFDPYEGLPMPAKRVKGRLGKRLGASKHFMQSRIVSCFFAGTNDNNEHLAEGGNTHSVQY